MTWESPRLVRHIMTRNLVVLHEEDNLAIAEDGIKTFSRRHLPVVEGEKLVGLLTERDLLRASVSMFDDDFALRDDNLKKYFFVRELMTTNVVTVQPDTTLLDAIQTMKEKKIGCLPVVSPDGRLVGIVTQSDFTSLAADLLRARDAERPSPPAAARAVAGHGGRG
jgi:CBS domain-containing protein